MAIGSFFSNVSHTKDEHTIWRGTDKDVASVQTERGLAPPTTTNSIGELYLDVGSLFRDGSYMQNAYKKCSLDAKHFSTVTGASFLSCFITPKDLGPLRG